jgi:ProP effector
MTSTPAKPASRNSLLETLATSFAVFRECRPLALGIHKTIIARMPEIDAAQLRLALRMHTASTRYLKALQASGERFDLDGAAQEEQEAQRKRQEKLAQLAARFNAR